MRYTLPLLALCLAAAPAAAQTAPEMAGSDMVERHQNATPGLILQSVTVKPDATMLILSGQLASPLPESANKPSSELTMADYGDTKTQTISTFNKIKGILEEHGFAMSDIIKLTVFVAGDPNMGGKMDFAGMNEGFRQFFGTDENPNTVARSALQVAALAGPNFLVEIEATAAK